MRSAQIQKLLSTVEEICGADNVSLYGSSPDEEHGTCFMIAGVPATFSVHTQDGQLENGQYDIQIENYPPGEYIYTDIVDLDDFMKLVSLVCGPEDRWPLKKNL